MYVTVYCTLRQIERSQMTKLFVNNNKMYYNIVSIRQGKASRGQQPLLMGSVCRVPGVRHSANIAFLPSVCHGKRQTLIAGQQPLLVGVFAVCLVLDTLQTLYFFRVLFFAVCFYLRHAANTVLPCVVCLPCVSSAALSKLSFCRMSDKVHTAKKKIMHTANELFPVVLVFYEGQPENKRTCITDLLRSVLFMMRDEM